MALPLAAEFWAAVDAAPIDKFRSSYEIDWGNGKARGQGKRRGGMVMGGMSDAPTGRKTYIVILGNAPLTDEEKAEASMMTTYQQMLIAKALAAGFSHDVAFIVSYTSGPEPMTREEAYECAARYER